MRFIREVRLRFDERSYPVAENLISTLQASVLLLEQLDAIGFWFSDGFAFGLAEPVPEDFATASEDFRDAGPCLGFARGVREFFPDEFQSVLSELGTVWVFSHGALL